MVPSSPTVTRLHRYATSPAASSTPIAAASIGARPGVVLGGIEAEDREVADVAPGRQSVRNDIGETHLGGRRERSEVRHVCGFERRAIVEFAQWLVGTSVGNQHHVLHVYGTRRRRAGSRRYPAPPMPRARGRERRTDRDRDRVDRDHRGHCGSSSPRCRRRLRSRRVAQCTSRQLGGRPRSPPDRRHDPLRHRAVGPRAGDSQRPSSSGRAVLDLRSEGHSSGERGAPRARVLP